VYNRSGSPLKVFQILVGVQNGCNIVLKFVEIMSLLHILTIRRRFCDICFFCRCTVHFDKVKIPFHQQMHLLLNIYKRLKIYINIAYIRCYMFRSTWTILRELILSLVNVTLLYNFSVKIRYYKFCIVVATCVSGCGVCTEGRAACDFTQHALITYTTT
jgi:hypothetical protein